MALEQLTQILGIKNFTVLLLIGLTILFILFFASRRTGGYERYYYRAKKMRRNQIAKRISNLEKKTLRFDKMITVLKIRENDLEIKFSVQRNESLQRELEGLRRQLTKLANQRDKLLEEKQAYSKAYREVTL